MSRLSAFVCAGGLWTLTSTAYLAYYVFSYSQFPVATACLGGCLAMTCLLSLAAGLGRAPVFRHIATALHLSIPMVWAVWLETVNQSALTPEQWITFAGCAFFGAALADQGVYLDVVGHSSGPRLSPTQSAVFKLGQLTALDSGGFPVGQLSAADSGSFRMP